MNLENLSTMDFEVLAKDIIECATNQSYRTFTSGADGGIDFINLKNPDIFGQAKHYIKTPIDRLISDIKKELQKVQKQNPKEYYIFTSKEISAPKTKELFKHFRGYMPSIGHIFDGYRIKEILLEDKYKHILFKHFKLWLTSSSILTQLNNYNLFIDTEMFLDDIKEKKDIFVQTTSYNKSLEILDKNRVLILTGNPGVGKSTITQMLVLHYAINNHVIKYSSDCSFRDIKEALFDIQNKDVLIVLDDFLGSTYMDINSTTPNEISKLLSYVKKYENLKIVLNSRVVILNQAKEQYRIIAKTITHNKYNQFMLNLNDFKNEEKEHILYNHVYYSKLPKDIKEEFYNSRLARRIVSHRNYTPRIVERITSLSFYNNVSFKKYNTNIHNLLNNPSTIWDDEFDYGLNKIDRDFMFCLYSVEDKSIKEDYLRACFNTWINSGNHDSTNQPFDKCLKRLNNSMIRIIIKNGDKFVTTINPSVSDFLENRLKNYILFQETLSNSISFNQLQKLRKINVNEASQYIHYLAKQNLLNTLKSFDKNKAIAYFNIFNQLEVKFRHLEVEVKRILMSNSLNQHLSKPYVKREAARVVTNFLYNAEYLKYYNLLEITLIQPLITQLIESNDIDNLVSIYSFYFTQEQLATIDISENFMRDKDIIELFIKYALIELEDEIKSVYEDDVIDYAKDEVERLIDEDIVSNTKDLELLAYDILQEVITNTEWEYDSTLDDAIEEYTDIIQKLNPDVQISMYASDIYYSINLEWETESKIEDHIKEIQFDIEKTTKQIKMDPIR